MSFQRVQLFYGNNVLFWTECYVTRLSKNLQKVFKKKSYCCKRCKICVNQGKPSFEDAHMLVYIYICMYVYVVLKVNSFLVNLCSWTPRKCNMSLQQIPSMMQQCLGRWTYYFSKVCHQFIQHVFQKSIAWNYVMLLSRTWPNIAKLEHAVLILSPSMFIAAVVKRLVPASLNAWRHRTASVQKGADGWKWPKPKKTWKKQTKIRESWLGPLPKSLDFFFRFCCCFFVGVSKVLPSVGHFKEAGMNHRQSCQSAFGSAVKHLKISSWIMGKLHSQGLPVCFFLSTHSSSWCSLNFQTYPELLWGKMCK